jgi:phosphate uptake regulator
MSGQAQEALSKSLKALLQKERRLAYDVILRDQYIDELELQVGILCLEFIIQQQPVAGNLLFVYFNCLIFLKPSVLIFNREMSGMLLM